MAGSIYVPLKTVFDDRGLKQAQKQISSFGNSLKGALGAAGISVGFSALTSALLDASKAAVQDTKSQALLAGQLKNTVGATDAQIASVESSIGAMSRMAAVADDEIRPAFSQLVRATGDVGKATALTSLALDIAAGTGKDVGTVSQALSKYINGSRRSLEALAPKIKGASDPMKILAETFKGAAERAANNDPFQKLNVIFGEMQEAIGMALLPSIKEFASFIASPEFTKTFANVAFAFNAIVQQIGYFAKSMMNNPFTPLFDGANGALIPLLKMVFVIGTVNDLIGKLFMKDFAGALNVVTTFGDKYDALGKDLIKQQKAAQKAADELAKGFDFDFSALEGFNFEIDKNSGKLDKNTAAQKANSKARIEYWKGVKAAADALKAEQEALAEAQKTIAESTKELTSVMSATELGEFESRVVSTFDNIRQSIQSSLDSGAISKAAAKSLTTYVDATSKSLAAIAKQRDALVAKRSLVEALFGDVKGSLMGAGSLSGLLEQTSKTVTKTVTSIVNGLQVAVTSTTEEITSGGLLKNFKAVLDKTKKFADQLKQLRKLGLDKNLFAEIVGAGAEAGGALANEIIAGGADAVAELNTAYKDLADVSGQIAEQTAVVMYNDGADVAGGLVAGLMSQEQGLIDAATTLANAFMDTFNSLIAQLQIPSQKTSVLASTLDTFDYAQILAGAGNAVTNEDIRFANIGQRVGATVNVTVNAGIGTDGKIVGQTILSEINRYQKANGI